MTADTLARAATIEKSIFLAADPDTVWEHLTRHDLLGRWFHPAEADLEEGQAYTLLDPSDGKRMCWGHVAEMRRPEYMRWSFTVAPLDGTMTTVEWRLAAVPGGTRLSLTHSGLPGDADGFGLVRAMDKGWHGFAMQMIALL